MNKTKGELEALAAMPNHVGWIKRQRIHQFRGWWIR